MPTLDALGRRHRGASIELMARSELADLAVRRMGVRRGHSIDRREVSMLFAESSEPNEETSRFFSAFERIYSFFSGDDPRYRSALSAACERGTVSFHPFRPDSGGHVAAGYLRAVGEDHPLDVEIELLPGDIEAAARTLEGHRLEAKHFVLLMPGSGSADKNWPAENFATLATDMNTSIQAATIMGPAEAELEKFFLARGLLVLKDLALAEVAAIAHQALAFIGNDSGISHLAAAAGAPGVVLFGPTEPQRWRPLGKRIKVLWRDPLDSLEPGEVARALGEIVG
jgi:heptosyltransferase-3